MAPAHTPLGATLVLLGAWAPGLVAVALTAWTAGRGAVSALLGRILIADVPVRYYVFAVAYIPAVKLTAAVLHRVILGGWPRIDTGVLLMAPVAVAFSTPFQAGEEIGWRGYALPRLAAGLGLTGASLVLGLIWALWHLPQFYIAGGDSYHQPFLVYTVTVAGLSVAFAWLYARSGGSLLLVMLLHSAINNTKDIVPSASGMTPGVFSLDASAVSWLTMCLVWICAAYLLVRLRGERLGGA